MNGVVRNYAPVPSPAVLRFLRIQAESHSFFAAQKQSCWARTRAFHNGNPRASLIRLDGGGSSGRKVAGSIHSRHHLNVAVRSTTSTRLKARITSFPPGIRHNSSSTQPLFKRWHRIRQNTAGPLQPNDLPSSGGFLDDSASLSRIVKPTNELQLRCTEFDENGNVTLVNGAFKKSELIAKVRSQKSVCRNND